eukprot:6185600-Pleurochrysis_carterae.AAC.3
MSCYSTRSRTKLADSRCASNVGDARDCKLSRSPTCYPRTVTSVHRLRVQGHRTRCVGKRLLWSLPMRQSSRLRMNRAPPKVAFLEAHDTAA